MSVSIVGAAVAVSVTNVVPVFDENEILLLLFQLYFEAKTASSELFVFSRIVNLTVCIRLNSKFYNSYSAKYLKVAI